ncbi:MAG TPA: endo alpha-1,4 polygalactosaminidase [Spirochaetota bacterium]|mgnify:CR=1 FL=1|nr:endo alpha-1,4 polygalactosaminidase [Spirochaetota bacterium]
MAGNRGNKIKNFMMKNLLILIFFVSICGCASSGGGDDSRINYSSEMRRFVIKISDYAKTLKPGFLVIPQNGVPLVTVDKEEDGEPAAEYLVAVDGLGQEDLFYGYDNDDEPTPSVEREYLFEFLDIAKSHGKMILVTDYCSTNSKIDDSYNQNYAKGYISFAAQSRDLDIIATYPVNPYNYNNQNIISLAAAKNFLYIINPELFADKNEFLNAVKNTDYDVVLIDLFFNGIELSSADIELLKTKNNGGSRLVIAYMSIGEAEDYRYYWNSSWNSSPPSWLDDENPDWPGNYKVKYWNSEWQSIIFGNNSSYLKKIINAGFDGAYLDIIDAYEYFED